MSMIIKKIEEAPRCATQSHNLYAKRSIKIIRRIIFKNKLYLLRNIAVKFILVV